ncbi:membrane protein [Mycobacterium phage Thonko]|uniref:Membrane protein n=1 Tax=Mycobacterium phage Thonko TaxID=2282910 RepID=A0A346FC64_9CAUD|nr:membrane protein [Mycobacterium phage Thonko]AXN53289.1 membrane protein [Mycobacterium phage Thonko]
MTAPWNGPRHRSWASNTMLAFYALIVCLIATVATDLVGEPPTYLVGLLGTAAGAFFGAIGTDKQKREDETRETAERAERKADALGDIARHEHPDDPPPSPPFDTGGDK